MMIDLSEVSLEVQFHLSQNPSPTIILSHPHPVYGGTMTNKVIDQIYRRSVGRDWSVLRYNTRGTGKSTGIYDHGNAEVKDLQELVGWITKQKGVDSGRILLIGYSFGSYLTAQAASNLKLSCILIAPAVTFYRFPVLDFNKSKVIFSAEKDELVDPALIEKYFETLAEPKQFISIPHADHYFVGTTTQLIQQVFKVLDNMQ
jgi:alpha/beta superfamily hydrolase